MIAEETLRLVRKLPKGRQWFSIPAAHTFKEKHTTWVKEKIMNRRDFLKYFTFFGASLTLGRTSAYGDWLTNEKTNGFPLGMLFIDAHAHPDIFPCLPSCDQTSTVEKIREIGMNASGFAVVEDQNGFESLMDHLLDVIAFEEEGKIRIIRKHSDLPQRVDSPAFPPGAILAVEGGTPLGTDVDKVDLLYDLGVRLITPMHNKVNAIGYTMKVQPPDALPHPDGGSLTVVGQQQVERMMSLGIIVDVAHAYINTLQGIAEIARINGVPIIDSHTSLTHTENYGNTRTRTFQEMEMIVETGGVVCTWPLSYGNRTSFLAWASETLQIAEHFGIEHVGLGTDGGGGLPELIEGYGSILDLPKLAVAMEEVGFKRNEIAAYMGKNMLRVIKQCLG
jgi:membrane dipeptidase